MTTYNYMCEMEQLCFKAEQALKVLGDKGLEDFYASAEVGYEAKAIRLGFYEANEEINQSQIESYLRVTDFVHEKELEAAEKLEPGSGKEKR